MPRLGIILKEMFNEEELRRAFLGKNIFSAWPDIIKATCAEDAASLCRHTKIKDYANGILTIEADHSGWRQILQIKKEAIITEIQNNYGYDIKEIYV
jgi:predicted nucleic acid-binding Zn ribbon protein